MKVKTFTKIHGDSTASDWQRVHTLEQICSQVKGTNSTTARDIDTSKNAIIYDFIDLPAPLLYAVSDKDVYAKIGQLLAQMHQASFDLASEYFESKAYPLSALGVTEPDAILLENALPPGWFHGDFWHGNVFWSQDAGLIVMDPIPVIDIFSPNYIRASGALDTASMYMSLLMCHPLHRQLRLDIDHYKSLAETFLKAYLEERQVTNPEVAGALRRLVRLLSLLFIQGYKRRLLWPISAIKLHIATRALERANINIR